MWGRDVGLWPVHMSGYTIEARVSGRAPSDVPAEDPDSTSETEKG